MSRTSLTTVLSALALASAAFSVGATLAAGAPSAQLGAPAPDFSLSDQSGKIVSLSSFAGKVVVLEWANPDCPFVVRHYKANTMTGLAKKYAGQGVVWLAINSSHYAGVEANKKFADQYGVAYPVLDDHTGVVGKAYGARTTPHMFVIDKAGKLVYQGAIDDDASGEKQGQGANFVVQALDAALAGKAVATAETKSYGCSVKYGKQ